MGLGHWNTILDSYASLLGPEGNVCTENNEQLPEKLCVEP